MLDKPPKGWAGPTGYVDGDLVTSALKKFGTTPDQKDKIKVFVCEFVRPGLGFFFFGVCWIAQEGDGGWLRVGSWAGRSTLGARWYSLR